jgi:hypothetical protein
VLPFPPEIAALCCCLAALLMARIAGASGEGEAAAARAEAKQLRDVGVAAEKRGDLTAALDAFQRAHARYPSPNMLFNIAIVSERLGLVSQAVTAFEQFLDEATTAPAVARLHAQSRLAQLEPEVARLALTASPAAATVKVDDRPIAVAGAHALALMPGDHVIEAVAAGRRPARRHVALTAGERRSLELQLEPEPEPPPAPAPPIVARPLATPSLTSAPPPRPLSKRTWFWPALAGGTAIVAAGITIGTIYGTRARYPTATVTGLEGN